MRPDLWNILEPVEVDPRVKSWKDVLRNLVFHANDTGEAWPNIETIRREVGYKSRKAVIDALAGLELRGLIGRVRDSKGRATKVIYRMTFDARSVNALSTSVNNSSNGEVSSPLLSTSADNGEVTSPLNGEVSSPLTKNGEVTSPFVDNSAKEARGEENTGRQKFAPSALDYAKGDSADTGVAALPDKRNVDYLALCRKPGWKPNDPQQTPPCDFEQAKRAVIACAYRSLLSAVKAKEFWHYNAIRKWNAIDCGSTVAELAFAFKERWFRDDPAAFWKEQLRRRRAAANRVLS